ncbi:MAG: cation diffusion facilitator family transporter, partial [Planctomycetota bacterium]|jgi:cation diffusion facilitator family transporter
VAAISVLSTFLLYSSLQCAGKSTGSAGLLAGAQQNLADTLTSSVVLISVALAQLGPAFHWCDSLGMGIVGLVIMKDAAASWWSDIRVLMDTSLPQDRLRQIRAAVSAVDGVMWTSFVKARRTGQGVWVDLGVLVPPERSISKAQQISTDARAAVLRRLSWVKDIDIYVYPTKNTFSRSRRNVAGPEGMTSLGRLSDRDSASLGH